MKKPSLSDVLNKKNAPVARATPVIEGDAGSADKGFVYRLTESDWRRLKDIALDQRTSLQQLVTDAINFKLQADGLPPITQTRETTRKK